MAAETNPGAASADDESATASVEQLRDVGAELLVEEADHDPDPRVDLRGGERRVQVAEVVVAGQDDDAGRA